MIRIWARRVLPVSALLLACGCGAPRSVLLSPQATPKGQFRGDAGFGFNIPTQTSHALAGVGDAGASLGSQSDTVAIPADSLNHLAKALLAYTLDPLSPAWNVGIRYGLWHRLDVGYRLSGTAQAVDMRYQWFGPEEASAPGWRGSLDLMYGYYDYGKGNHFNPDVDAIKDLLDFELTRQDIVVPLILGKPLGKDSRLGWIGFGLVYDWSRVEWSSHTTKVIETLPGGATRPYASLQGDKSISAYGGFVNARLSLFRLYLVGSLTAYWQDYGTYALFGGKSAALSGWTVMPVLGLETRM